MRHRLSLALGVIGLAMTIPASIASQQKLTPAPDLRLPPYDNKYVLKITPGRLDELETKLKSFPDDAAEEKKSDQASTARQQWRECRNRAEAAMRGSPQARQADAEMKANSSDMKKLREEAVERMKNAKTPEEMMKIQEEIMHKQKVLMPQTQPPSGAAAEQQVAGKCGTEPAAASESKRLEGPPGIFLMIERVAGLCREEPSYVGPDGSLSTWEAPFNSRDRGMSQTYNVKVYSPSEVKLVRQRCQRVMPLIQSRGKALGKDYSS
jgi:hypothetical protein